MRTATKLTAALAALATLPASAVAARPVELRDARVAPDHVRVLKPGATASAGVCRDESTDVQAYTGTGGALGEQGTHREQGRTLFHYWRDPRSGEYVYLTRSGRRGPGQWINNTPHAVLVATWCS